MKGFSWKKIGHSFLCCLSILVLTNVIFIREGINLVTGQFIVLIVTCGFYIFEERWGITYAAINIVPLLIFGWFSKFIKINFDLQFQSLNYLAYQVILVYNFVSILYIHYFFFRALKLTFKKNQVQRERLTEALRAAKYTAEEKTNFLSTMSHELRTPLNAVIGMTNVLITKPHLKEQVENLNVLQFSSENLMNIINDILDFNKIDAGKLETKSIEFRLDNLLSNLCSTFKVAAENKGIDFKCTHSESLLGRILKGDQPRLVQILFNLVGNAVKFTNAGYVNVKVETSQIDEVHLAVNFSIEDSGIGIPKEEIAFIYEPYAQANSGINRQYHGTGLGLTIAKRLIDFLGGNLNLDTQEGIGSSFSFSLEFKNVGQEFVHEKRSRPELRDLSDLKILVAEDNPINVLVMTEILWGWSILPIVVENGKLAVEAVLENDYDVVLMDINMPVMDGFEASRLIRELPDQKKAATVIIAVTASIGAAIEKTKGYEYLDNCLLKPFKPEDLHDMLKQIL
ncbi:ATP-binding protein [Pedobacter terrae]|uniref:ATP-binding protein n=1 Tax=Pedobacter terrae TaxID=405671 RepID=UPI002FFD2594